jgi:RNA polymerase sigma-70 factor (ECF subfamily)
MRLGPLPRADAPDELDEETLYGRHFDQVARWAKRLGGPGVDAEDVAHDVFVVVFRRLAEWRGEASPSTWLFRITERVVKTHRRRARWSRQLAGLLGDYAPHAADARPGPREQAETNESVASFYRGLEQLDDKHRTAFILAEVDDLSAREIAALQNVPEATVWVRIHRARQRLLAFMERTPSKPRARRP